MKEEEQRWRASTILEEALSTEKHMTNIYNNAANESSNDSIRQNFVTILMEEHQLLEELLAVIQRRGLYHPQHADTREISQANHKYNH